MNFGSIIVVIIICYLVYFTCVILYDVLFKKSARDNADDAEDVFFVGDVEEVKAVEVENVGEEVSESSNEKKKSVMEQFKPTRPSQPETEIEEAITIGNGEIAEMVVETQGIPLDSVLRDVRAAMGGINFG